MRFAQARDCVEPDAPTAGRVDTSALIEPGLIQIQLNGIARMVMSSQRNLTFQVWAIGPMV